MALVGPSDFVVTITVQKVDPIYGTRRTRFVTEKISSTSEQAAKVELAERQKALGWFWVRGRIG